MPSEESLPYQSIQKWAKNHSYIPPTHTSLNTIIPAARRILTRQNNLDLTVV